MHILQAIGRTQARSPKQKAKWKKFHLKILLLHRIVGTLPEWWPLYWAALLGYQWCGIAEFHCSILAPLRKPALLSRRSPAQRAERQTASAQVRRSTGAVCVQKTGLNVRRTSFRPARRGCSSVCRQCSASSLRTHTTATVPLSARLPLISTKSRLLAAAANVRPLSSVSKEVAAPRIPVLPL